ncbi:nuclear transport factor 2 family protein [Bacillus sp. JJ1764]|uniref:nuclear transport factor 2 family protein n=1 Tax=Bacillus sp. JJ1764 TaxID=3122964 RepID=UPI003000A3BD
MIGEEKKEMVRKYVDAYNSFNVNDMFKLLHDEILFRNISNGQVDTETKGILEFRELAEKSSRNFSSRKQTIINIATIDNQVEVQIDYEGILAVDLPNGLKSGDKLQLIGKSLFGFKEGKISLIEDYS